jgi:hypothetical protein
VLAEV